MLKGVPPCAYFAFRSPVSSPQAVGHNPDSLSLVRCAGMDCSQHSPSRIIPHRGQVSENDSKPPRSKNWRVFHERVSRSNFANDPGHFSPESRPIAFDPRAFSCGADILTREPASDDIHHSTPRAPIEGSHIVPDGEGIKAPVILSGHEHVSGAWLVFDGADGSPPEELAPEYASTSACEKCQLIHFRDDCFHLHSDLRPPTSRDLLPDQTPQSSLAPSVP